MASATYAVHLEAQLEVDRAVAWYERISPELAREFAAEVHRAINAVAEHPTRWPPYLARTRRILLQRFPYSVVYRFNRTANTFRVFAVEHHARRRGRWRKRLRFRWP